MCSVRESLVDGVILAQFEDAVPECGLQVRVRDLLDTHVVHQAQVLPLLLALELVNCKLPVVDRQPQDQFLIVSNILVGDLYGSLEVEDILFLALVGLEDALERGLSLRELLELLLVVALLRLGS